MFLDDLQWADDASLELLSSLVQDDSLRHFLFIGAMRGTEVDKNNGAVADFLRQANKPSKKFVRIELLNLSIQDIGDFVSDTLNMSFEQTWPLTEIIYGKTRGNIFYSIQTLEELHRRNVLYFSMISFHWEWNLKGLEFDNSLSSNVVEAVASKIQSMPERLQRALVIAAYTRSNIDVNTLMALMIADTQDVDQKEVVGLLDIAVLEGLMKNTVGSNVYRFSHDRIKEAAYWMVPSGQERDRLRITIGKSLVELASRPEGRDWMLFVAADHLNSCRGHGQDDLFLAELNLLCGQKASKLAAFVPASLYLRLALKYLRKLGDNPWESHYDLSLRVYRDVTNTELCLGNIDSGNELGHRLIDKATSLEDRLPTYLALAVGKGRQHRHAESMVLCQDALLRLKAIPKRMRCIKMMHDFASVKKLLKTHSDQEILTLPVCQDKNKSIVMDFFTEYAYRSFHCGNFVEFFYAVLKRIRISFKYGLARGSANAFASYGIFLQGPGSDQEGALRMARLAREMIGKTERFSGSTNALTLLIIASFIEPWTYPRERIMETLQHAHHIGMASGNIEIGFLNWTLCNSFAQTCGYPLEPIEKAGNELKQQLRLYHVDSVLDQFEHIQLVISCLLGEKTINWEDMEPRFVADEKEKLYRNVFGYLSRLEVGVYFGNFEFAVRMSTSVQPYVKLDGSYATTTKEHFFSSLAYCGLARGTRNRKYVSLAVKFAKRLRCLCRTRGTNVLHRCLLMEAEILTFRCDNPSKLITAYDNAIHSASQAGYIHDAALGCELAGSTMLELGEENRGYRYLSQARDLWREYEAHAKVNLLVKKYGRKLDSVGTETSRSDTVADHYYVSSDFSDTHRKSLDLTLLSGSRMRTDISAATGKNTIVSKDRQDEISILSDPSSVGATSRSQVITWSRQ
jgi:histidine kinase